MTDDSLNVINLYGGPGSGKSTVAAGLYYTLKVQHRNVELVTEFAKDLVYLNHLENLLDQQEFIFAEQNNRLHRLRGKVEWAITDSPIMLAPIYARKDYPCLQQFTDLVVATDKTYNNVNIFLDRPDTFMQEGRVQNLDQSKEIDNGVLDMLNQQGIVYKRFQTGPDVVDQIIRDCINV